MYDMWIALLVKRKIIPSNDSWASTYQNAKKKKKIWSRQYTKRTPSPCCFLLLTILFIFNLSHPHVINLGFRYFFFWKYGVSTALTITSTNIWLIKFLDSCCPGSSTGPSQNEPSQTQDGPSSISSPVIFFCGNCGEGLKPAVFLCSNCGGDLEKAVFGQTLQYQTHENKVVCCCCKKNHQDGLYVSIPNYFDFLLYLFKGRFLQDGSDKLRKLATCPGILKSHMKIYKHSRLTKGCTFPYLIVMCVTNICIFWYIVTYWTTLLVDNFAAFRKCLCRNPWDSVDCHGKALNL